MIDIRRRAWTFGCWAVLGLTAACQPITFWELYGDAASHEEGRAVAQLSDGGFAVAGATGPASGPTDLLVVRSDVRGEMQWSRVYGTSKSDSASGVVAFPDGGLLVVGSSFDASDTRGLLVRTDPAGEEMWRRALLAPTGSSQAIQAIRPTADGGFVLVGSRWIGSASSVADMLLLKVDGDGVEEWSKTYGGAGYEEAYGVAPAVDGGFFLAGVTTSYGAGNFDAWLVKTDSSGTRQWDKTFGTAGYDDGSAVIAMADGGAAFSGTLEVQGASHPYGDALVVRTDALGEVLWSRHFGDPDRDEHARDIQHALAGGLIVGGYGDVGTSPTNIQVMLAKLDDAGTSAWTRYLGGAAQEKGQKVLSTSDGGYALAGTSGQTFSDGQVLLVKTDAEGGTTPPP
ncbi:MAG: hypothetical protein U0610_16955 [bacterium]